MGQINYRCNQGIVSSDGSSPLSGTYYEAGSFNGSINSVLAASGSVVLIPGSWGAPGQVTGALQAVLLLCNQNCTIQTNGSGAIGVQSVTITGTPTGGVFSLDFKGQVAGAIAYNVTAAALQTALQALSTIGSGNVACSGGPLPGTAITCTFSGPVVQRTVPLLTASAAGLTGGTSPAVVVVNTTGTPQDVIQLVAGDPLFWSISPGYFPCPFLGAVTAIYATNVQACTVSGRYLTY